MARYEELLAELHLVYMYWTRPDPSPLRYLFHSGTSAARG
jgi:hypothetical protein